MNMFLFSEWYLEARGDRDRDWPGTKPFNVRSFYFKVTGQAPYGVTLKPAPKGRPAGHRLPGPVTVTEAGPGTIQTRKGARPQATRTLLRSLRLARLGYNQTGGCHLNGSTVRLVPKSLTIVPSGTSRTLTIRLVPPEKYYISPLI
jgi:hypothetical protein